MEANTFKDKIDQKVTCQVFSHSRAYKGYSGCNYKDVAELSEHD